MNKNKLCCIIISFVLLCSCATTEENSDNIEHTGATLSQFEQQDSAKKLIDSIIAASDLDAKSAELVSKMLKDAVNNPNQFSQKMEDVGKNMLVVSPNPTSSSATVEFFKGQPPSPIPALKLDLFYENQKVHTFNLQDVRGSFVIQESYLQREGTYTIAVDFFQNGSPVSTSFIVVKKR
ncbi:MAG: hypothetical protein LBO69_08135 [Ignavibacteria bacterium]|jgi:hypothetical protein|nr:hypothetical protein [Ignavibacteria bacterium]